FSSLLSAASEKKYRIAYMRDTLQSPALQPEIKTAIEKSLDQLKLDGHSVAGIEFPLNEYVLPTYYILATAEASSNLSRYDGVRYGYRSPNTTDLESMYKKTRAEGFGKEVQRRILLGTYVLSASYFDAYYNQAQKVRRLIREKLKELLKEYDFIITPTTPTTAFKLGEHSTNPVEMYLADLFSVQANVAGLPAISLPLGTDKIGLPIGVQVMADDFEETKLFHFSKQLMNLA
ncbi:MAG: Asp-tRNA(Asn)/Glu-tRNA(Gln) amidotransferase subunit GatA, partial [Cytophagales bacterium]|nr:Asp-tRNA(Asn)/Glu-tRNA(Gln) amidotransferase subunit GatA [Cytophagales bacterium]